MDNKSLLHNMGGWPQFFFFLFLSYAGLIIGVLAIGLFMSEESMQQSARDMRLAQAISAICMFILPSLIFGYLCHGNPKVYLKADTMKNLLLLFLTILLIFLIQPTVNFISYYNQQLAIPKFLSWIKEYEESAERTFALLFSDKSTASLVFNLLVVAVVAGLGEELFFRGCLQQIVQKIVNNKHAAVWITSIVFSAVHFQFYGFIPRVFLGALLGYLFIWSGSIWVPVIVHTIHNAINVVLIHFYYGTPKFEQMEDFSFEKNIWLIIPSLILSGLVLFTIYKKSIIKQESV